MLGNYRVIRHGQGGDVRYSIHLVHYNEDGHPISCSKETVSTMSESVAGVRWTLELMMKALHEEALDSSIFLTEKDKERLAEVERMDEATRALMALPTWEEQKAEAKRLGDVYGQRIFGTRLFTEWFIHVGHPNFEKEYAEETKRQREEQRKRWREEDERKAAAKSAKNALRKAKIK